MLALQGRGSHPAGRRTTHVLVAALLVGLPVAADAQYTFTDVTSFAGVADGHDTHFGSCWVDYNKDGWLDLYVANDAINTMYESNGDGTFTDVTTQTQSGDPWVAMRNVFADYDRDGDLDFYSHNFVQSTLYRNDLNVYTDVNILSGTGVMMARGTGASWGDYDNDGWLDLHATGFPGWNVLFKNNGDGTFSDAQPGSGLTYFASGMGNGFGDYDNDGYLDLAVAAVTPDGDLGFVYHNEGDGTFTNATGPAGITWDDGCSTAAVSWGDYDNDGFLDLVITEVFLGSTKILPHRIYLWRNKGDGTFEEKTTEAGVFLTDPMASYWEASWADYDSDGDLDLYIGSTELSYNYLYQNNGNGTFTDVAAAVGLDHTITTIGGIWGDYDKDGDIDLYVCNQDKTTHMIDNYLMQNTGGPNHYIQVELLGTVCNPDAIGAQVTVVWPDGHKLMQEVNGGTGFFSQHSHIQHFGLGPHSYARKIIVKWPGGNRQVLFNVPADQVVFVKEKDPENTRQGQPPQQTPAPRRFSDQTEAMNVAFTHNPPADDIMHLGAGAAFGDFDDDGDLDLFVAQREGASALFRNLGNGLGFEDYTRSAGLALNIRESTGGLWGDYDNDGDQDLLILNRGDNLMCRNDGSDGSGGWNFVNATVGAGLTGVARTAAAVYGDYDNDGFLDLYVANHSYSKTAPAPGDPFHSDVLYHNIPGPGGTRRFLNVTSQLDPVRMSTAAAHSAGWFDYDDDGDLDLYVVNEEISRHDPAITGENFLWRNDGTDGVGGWLFTEVAASLGVDLQDHPMGMAIGDYNNDGLWDFALSDLQDNSLWLNQGGSFLEVGAAAGINRPVVPDGTANVGWGIVFADINLDGHEDLYVAAGGLNPGLNNQPNPLFLNEGNGVTFTEVPPQESGAYLWGRQRTVIKGDVDQDGDEDLYLVTLNGECRLLRNDQPSGTTIAIKLVGTTSNRDAIGAKVCVTAGGMADQYRMVQSGSTTGGGHDRTLYFGCPGVEAVDAITVDWPAGGQSVLNNVTVNQVVTIIEP